MKNTIRCCISCILPCGALDVIRIVHSNGRVEEITGTIKASDVMKTYPKHILKKPTRLHDDSHHHHHDHHRPAIVVVPPEALLQRGKIYFLIPVSSSSSSSQPSPSKKKTQKIVSSTKRENSRNNSSSGRESNNTISVRANLVFSDQYLSEILSEKVSTQKERRRGRVAVWRPHLESISETLSEAASTTSTDQ